MSTAQLVAIYPVPTDLEKFERLYLGQHVSMAVDRLTGRSSCPSGTSRACEISFIFRKHGSFRPFSNSLK